MSEAIIQTTLDIARSKLGMHEEEGENRGAIVAWAMHPWSKAEVGPWAEWCAAFACTCYYEAGSSKIRSVGSTSVPRLWKNCIQAGCAWLHSPESVQVSPEVGDIVFFNGLGHVALIEQLDGNTIYTIEGNHGDEVAQDQHDLQSDEIYGFARIE